MTDNGFGQDEYGQPKNSMGFVTDDKHTEEKKIKNAAKEKRFDDMMKKAHRDSYMEEI